jgi:hypothetical protein
MSTTIPFRPVAAAALALLAGCAGDKADAGETAPVVPTLTITSTDTTCHVAPSTIDSGTMRMVVRNEGTIVTEAYIYAPGDLVVTEIEHVQPGDHASLKVRVGGGRYEVACKPGERGNGNRTPLVVEGAVIPTTTIFRDPAPFRGVPAFGVKFEAVDGGFDIDPELGVAIGQKVTFQFHNGTAAERTFRLSGPDGSPLGAIGPLAPDASGELQVEFTVEGTVSYDDPGTPGSGGSFPVVP